jgi:hypothetical protein
VQALSGSEDSSGTLQFDLGNYVLRAGSYWLTAYVTRPQSPSGMDQWFFDTFRPVNGSQAQLYNPGDGFGFGSNPFPISDVLDHPEDLAFTLSGNAVPEPSGLTLVATATIPLFGYLSWRKRVRRS